jgi:hypothetical protein
VYFALGVQHEVVTQRAWNSLSVDRRGEVFGEPDRQIRLTSTGILQHQVDEVSQIAVPISDTEVRPPRRRVYIPALILFLTRPSRPKSFRVGMGKLGVLLVCSVAGLGEGPVLLRRGWVERLTRDTLLEVVFSPWQIGSNVVCPLFLARHPWSSLIGDIDVQDHIPQLTSDHLRSGDLLRMYLPSVKWLFLEPSSAEVLVHEVELFTAARVQIDR